MGKMTKTSAEVAQVAHRRAQEAYAEFQEGSRPVGEPNSLLPWLEEDRTVGDIDIDYRAMHEGHHHPSNSDIRAGIAGGETHHERHVEKFGYIQDWWRIP